MRLVAILVLLAGLFTLPLLVIGDRFDAALTGSGGVGWLQSYGGWAGLVGVGLLVADLVLPIPGTAIMAALGIIYGVAVGGLIGAAGSMAAGGVAYGASRLLGRRAALFLVGERDLARVAGFFKQGGGWAVAVSRPMPLIAEVVACLAGLAGMQAGRFLLALACGSLPMGMAFAALGASGSEHPLFALAVSAAVPLLLWPIVRRGLNAGAREV